MQKLWARYKVWIIIALGVVILGTTIYLRRPVPSYDSYTVSTNTIADTLELSGKVTAEKSATLRFATGGLLSYVGAKEGDTVKKWSTIARLDTRQLQKTLEEKLNLYSIQRGSFEQTIDDNNNSVPAGDLGNTLKRLLEKNQYQLDNTVKDVEYQNLSISLAILTSPFDGILIHSPVTTAGVTVLPTDTWTVVDPTSLYFSADLDETDLHRVTLGQAATVKLDAYPDQAIKTTISSIGYTPTETSTGTTYEVKIGLSNADLSTLRLGLNGTASIVLEEKPGALTLPAAAISLKNGTSSVYVMQNGKYVENPVKTGIENAGQVEITSGVENGQTVYQLK